MTAAPHLRLTHPADDEPVHPHLELFAALGELRNRLYEKYEPVMPAHLVRQIVAQAEALAWQTPFPHLFLPDYAEVRVAEVLRQVSFAEAA